MSIQHEAILGRINYYKLDPSKVTVVDGWNPRKDFDGEEELVNYILQNGVENLDPLRFIKNGNIIELVAGERRWRAIMNAISLGAIIPWIPAKFIDNKTSETEKMLIAISENEGKPLNPVEEAEAYRRLKGWGMSVSDIARRVGKSTVHIYRRLVLVDASPELQAEIKAKNITLVEAEKIVKESGGSIDGQNKRTRKVRKSNIMKAKAMRTHYQAVQEGSVELKRDDTDYLEGYLDALRQVLGV